MGVAPYKRLIHGDWIGLERIVNDLYRILNADTTLLALLTPPGSDGEIIYNKDGVYGADSTFSFNDSTKVLTAQVLKITSVAASSVDTDKFLVDDSDEIKFRTGAEVLSDIGGSASGHLHDGATLQHDGVNSDGGAFAFSTTGLVTFNQSIAAANYTAAALLTACATNAGALDFSAASKTLTVEDNAIVSQDYSSDASPAFAGLTVTNCAVLGSDSAVFQPNADSVTFFQVKNAAGTVIPLNIDTTNNQVIVGRSSATYPFVIKSSDGSDQVQLHHDNTNAYLRWNDGTLYLQTDEGTNSISIVSIIGKGTQGTIIRAYNAGNAGFLQFFASATQGQFGAEGNLTEMSIQEGADATVSFFRNAGVGEVPYVRIYGRNATDAAKRNLAINMSTDDDTVLFDNMGNYEFRDGIFALRNTTHEDSDGGRESKFDFRGEQSGGERSTLARIEASHVDDGVDADDEKGQLQFFYNADADGDSPTLGMTMNYLGTAIGDGGTTNYSKFEVDGTLEFNGAATVWNDLVLPLDFAKVPAANAPDWESFVGNLNAYAYKVNDFQEFTSELLHGYKEGSAFTFHIHGALNALTAQEEKVQFEIEYSVADMDATDGIGDVFPDGSGALLTNELVVPNATADLSNIYITIGVDTQASFAIGATVKGRIRRIAKSAGGVELTGNIFVTQVGIHYEIDTVGSRTELTK